jgi:formylglycine-generating enzyme required for sulfatase activity
MFRSMVVASMIFIISGTAFSQLSELIIAGRPVKSQTQLVTSGGAGGPVYAAIQFVSNMDGFRYDAYNGIVRVDDQPGKDMVFLRIDETVVEIFLTGYKPLKVNLSEQGIQLAPKDIWIVNIQGKQEITTVPIQILFDPSDAVLFIDNSAAAKGPVYNLKYGKHHIKISKTGYETLEEVIDISRPNMTVSRQLKQIPAAVEPAAGVAQKTVETPVDTSGEQEEKTLEPALDEAGKNLKHAASVKSTSAPMILVKGGTFSMGSMKISNDESPVHNVTLKSFYIGKYEVTFIEYDTFCRLTRRGSLNDNGWGRGNRPVIQVSWNDAIAYCNWRSQFEGLTPCYSMSTQNVQCNFNANGFRLPTEAEWEYAARGGSESHGFFFSGSDYADEVTWYHHNSDSQTKPVGTKMPNELGIYDMSGNVWEWCWDWYDKDYYTSSSKADPLGPISGFMNVLRGGSWSDNPRAARISNRFRNYPVTKASIIGFRIARTAVDQ